MFYLSPPSLNDPEGRAMAQAVSHCALIPCGDVVDKVALGQFLLRHFGFHLPLSFHQSCVNIHSSPANAIYSYRMVASVGNTITPFLRQRKVQNTTCQFCHYVLQPKELTETST